MNQLILKTLNTPSSPPCFYPCAVLIRFDLLDYGQAQDRSKWPWCLDFWFKTTKRNDNNFFIGENFSDFSATVQTVLTVCGIP